MQASCPRRRMRSYPGPHPRRQQRHARARLIGTGIFRHFSSVPFSFSHTRAADTPDGKHPPCNGSSSWSYRLCRVHRYSYGVGHMFNDLSAACWYTYLLLFLVKVARLRPVDAGIVMLTGHIVDACFTPCVGVGSDACSHPYGRRKTWHLAGSVAAAFALPFLFRLPLEFMNGNGAHMFYYLAVASIFQMGWAAMQTAHLSLVIDLTSNRDERAGLNSLRSGFSIISTMSVYTVAWVLLRQRSVSQQPSAVLGSGSGSGSVVDFRPWAAEKSVVSAGTFSSLGLVVTACGVIAAIAFHCGVAEPLPASRSQLTLLSTAFGHISFSGDHMEIDLAA